MGRNLSKFDMGRNLSGTKSATFIKLFWFCLLILFDVVCRDMYESCKQWAKQGFCSISDPHYSFMKHNCRHTCHFCHEQEDSIHSFLGESKDAAVSNKEWKVKTICDIISNFRIFPCFRFHCCYRFIR